MARLTRKEAADKAITICADAVRELDAGEYTLARDLLEAALAQTAAIVATSVAQRKVQPAEVKSPRVSSSLVTGLRVLDCFDGSALMGVADVADTLRIPRSTAHRYLTTLVRLGQLEQPSTGRKYRRPQLADALLEQVPA